MKTLQEHRNKLIKAYRERLLEYTSLFDLKMKMMEERICPKCGIATCVGDRFYFRCLNTKNDCNFKLSEAEYNLIVDGREGILWRKIRK